MMTAIPINDPHAEAVKATIAGLDRARAVGGTDATIEAIGEFLAGLAPDAAGRRWDLIHVPANYDPDLVLSAIEVGSVLEAVSAVAASPIEAAQPPR